MRVGRLAGLAVLALVGYDRVVRPWLRGWAPPTRSGERPSRATTWSAAVALMPCQFNRVMP